MNPRNIKGIEHLFSKDHAHSTKSNIFVERIRIKALKTSGMLAKSRAKDVAEIASILS